MSEVQGFTTKEEYEDATAALQAGLLLARRALLASKAFGVKDVEEIVASQQEAEQAGRELAAKLAASPFVSVNGVIQDATPETKATETALINQAFDIVFGPQPPAEPPADVDPPSPVLEAAGMTC